MYFIRRYRLVLFLMMLMHLARAQVPALSDKLEGLRAAIGRSEADDVQTFFFMARIFADPSHDGYYPDSAYHYLSEAQRYWRRLPEKSRKQLDKREGISLESMGVMRRDLREKGLAYALDQGTVAAIDQYLTTYDRLSSRYLDPAMQARHEFFYAEAQAESVDYEKVALYFRENESSIAQLTPHLSEAFQDLLVRKYIGSRDSLGYSDIFQFLRSYPHLSPLLDERLAKLVRRSPYIAWVEEQISQFRKIDLPETQRAVFDFYTFAGDLNDLSRFYSRYEGYGDSSFFRREVDLLKRSPDLTLPFEASMEAQWGAFIRDAAPRRQAWLTLEKMIKPDLEARNWVGAIEKIERYREAFGPEAEKLDSLLRILRASPDNITPVSLGEVVNSERGEYSPVVSADGRHLFFCRRDGDSENVYVSHMENGAWSAPEALAPFNQPIINEAPLGISADGTTLLVFKEARVMYSDKNASGWSKPVLIFDQAQKSKWQGGTTISADRQAVIFAARRLDRIGLDKDPNIDLFVCLRAADGSWGPPVNLGPKINTPWTDRSPFLHPDMKTLYFSSDGHGGLGDLDVYKTTRIGDSWTEWTEPVNLGKEINTPGADWGYKVSTDGAYAYFSADVDGRLEDLFYTELPMSMRPEAVATIDGRLTGLDGQPFPAEITIADLSTGQTIGTVKPDPASGAFFITLPAGRLYSYTVQSPGRFPVSNNIDLREGTTGSRRTEHISVPTYQEMIRENIAIPLKNLFFETGKFDIKPESFPELRRLAALIRDNDLRVAIAGHTDNVGSEVSNQRLSEDRANAARDYLISQGCEPAWIRAEGFGMSRPLTPNDTEEGRARNRRVEIRLIQ